MKVKPEVVFKVTSEMLVTTKKSLKPIEDKTVKAATAIVSEMHPPALPPRPQLSPPKLPPRPSKSIYESKKGEVDAGINSRITEKQSENRPLPPIPYALPSQASESEEEIQEIKEKAVKRPGFIRRAARAICAFVTWPFRQISRLFRSLIQRKKKIESGGKESIRNTLKKAGEQQQCKQMEKDPSNINPKETPKIVEETKPIPAQRPSTENTLSLDASSPPPPPPLPVDGVIPAKNWKIQLHSDEPQVNTALIRRAVEKLREEETVDRRLKELLMGKVVSRYKSDDESEDDWDYSDDDCFEDHDAQTEARKRDVKVHSKKAPAIDVSEQCLTPQIAECAVSHKPLKAYTHLSRKQAYQVIDQPLSSMIVAAKEFLKKVQTLEPVPLPTTTFSIQNILSDSFEKIMAKKGSSITE